MEKDNSRFNKICNLTEDHPMYDEIMSMHSQAMEQDRFFYLDPLVGFTVFTAKYLFELGHYCGSNCRHCPYSDEDL
jgi:hypothetical protein